MNKSFLIFICFIVVMLTACGGGGGGGSTNTSTNTNSSGGGPVITVPGAPIMGAATAGNAQATVTFTAPASNGGAPITSYTVTSNTGGITASGSASPLTVTGLTNGQAYTFTVTATNSAGTGPASASSNSVTPLGIPIVSVTATSPKALTFSWTAIAGATHYKLLKNPNGVSGYTQVVPDLPNTVTTAKEFIGVHLHDWVNARYIVQACNAGGCVSSSDVFTTSAMIAAIGYIKASNSQANDWFGFSLSMSADGTTLAVGAWSEASSTTGINSAPNELANFAGAVYVFNRSGTIWSQQAYVKASNTGAGDQFGTSVSLSADGSTLAVGAYVEDSSTSGINSVPNEGATNAGAVYVYTRSGSTWSQQAYVKASNTGADDWFGWSVALSADGATLAVGARQEDSSTTGINSLPDELAAEAGAIYIFTRSGITWTQQAYVKASNTGAGDEFGYSVSLSSDGATMAVGANLEDSSTTGINSTPDEIAAEAGAVYVYARSGISWSQQAYVKSPNTSANNEFGISVSLSGDGATLAAGNELGFDRVYLYARSGSVWSYQDYVEASPTGGGDGFGTSVSFSADGATLVVGAPFEDSDTAGINSTPNELLNASGAVYVFNRSGITWSQRSYVKASNPGDGDFFGYAVSVSADGTTIGVAARFEDSNTRGINSTPNESASDAGAVYLY